MSFRKQRKQGHATSPVPSSVDREIWWDFQKCHDTDYDDDDDIDEDDGSDDFDGSDDDEHKSSSFHSSVDNEI